jgi:hypothetical protein
LKTEFNNKKMVACYWACERQVLNLFSHFHSLMVILNSFHGGSPSCVTKATVSLTQFSLRDAVMKLQISTLFVLSHLGLPYPVLLIAIIPPLAKNIPWPFVEPFPGPKIGANFLPVKVKVPSTPFAFPIPVMSPLQVNSTVTPFAFTSFTVMT